MIYENQNKLEKVQQWYFLSAKKII